MSNCERIAQVAQDKWATVSDFLRSLMINELMSNSLKKKAICSFALLSWATWANCSQLSNFLTVANLSWATWAISSQLLICPEGSEQIAQSRFLQWALLSKWAMSEWANEQNPNPGIQQETLEKISQLWEPTQICFKDTCYLRYSINFSLCNNL